MKSGKPKTKRYQFGGTLRSQISGTRNAPPPTRPAPAPVKPAPPLVNPASMKPLPTEVRTASDAYTMPLDKTVYRSPAVPSKPTGLGAMPATPTKTTGRPFNLPAGTVDNPLFSAKAPTGGLSGALAGIKTLNVPARGISRNDLKMANLMKKGGKVSSASSRGDGIAQRGKTKGRIV